MIEALHYSPAGAKRDTKFALPAEMFDGTVNEDVLHQAVKVYLNNQRQGTAKTKGRSEVSGGNQKPWKQKGTGRARQGSTRAPHWRGGGIVFGPQPRDYTTAIPKKVRQLARRSALNARAREENLLVVERLSFDAPKTRRLTELLGKVGAEDAKVLVLTNGHNPNVYLSGRNLPTVQVMNYADASAYDILWSEKVVVEEAALTGVEPEVTDEPAADSAPRATKTSRPARAKAAKATKKAAKAAKKSESKAAKKAAPKKKAAKKTATRSAKKPAPKKKGGK
ncbi:MAG TPA: 50S ribosomal protein L4 [Gemmatimonadales bacterium]|nr:50S ribosomal protein L4 [Gemmatimonadales bacterium]